MVFIVITFGIGAANQQVPNAMWVASLGALSAAVVVIIAGVIVRRPPAMVPENTMKYSVGLLLCSFGVFWSIEGLGYFTTGGDSLSWPGGSWALAGILLGWFVLCQCTAVILRRIATRHELSTASN